VTAEKKKINGKKNHKNQLDTELTVENVYSADLGEEMLSHTVPFFF